MIPLLEANNGRTDQNRLKWIELIRFFQANVTGVSVGCRKDELQS